MYEYKEMSMVENRIKYNEEIQVVLIKLQTFSELSYQSMCIIAHYSG